MTITHVRRWLIHRGEVGTGHVYQGRYKSFAIQDDGHLSTVCRYVRHHQTLKHDLRAGAQCRLDGLLEPAIDAVDEQISRGDGRLALEFLREMKVTPRSSDLPQERAPAERSETVVEMVQQRLSVTTSGPDTKSDKPDSNRTEIVTKKS